MMRFSPRIGLRFLEDVGRRAWELTKRTVTGRWLFEDDDGKTEPLTRDEVHERWRDRRWVVDESCLGKAARAVRHVVPGDVRTLNEKKRKELKRRLRYLLAIERSFRKGGGSFISTVAALAPKIDEAAKRMKDKDPPSPATVWRWWNRFFPTRSVMKLVDGRRNSGRSRDERVFGIFEEVINEVFLNPQRFQIKRVFERVDKRIKRINEALEEGEEPIRRISRATVYRWVKTLYYALVLKARAGKKVSQRELRIAQDSVHVDRILERVEIDHTPLDLQVIDRVTRLVLGRPWITLAIDRKSRCILGFYVSFNPPSAYSVLACLRRAILPKGDLLKLFPGIRSPWPCHGVMELVAVDNGMDLHADDVELAALAMAIEILYCGVAHPEMKGAIERVFRTLAKDLIHELPGTTFSNKEERGDYESEKRACIDIQTLTYLLVKWICDVYHQTPHRGLSGKTPLEVWNEGEAECAIELPVDPAQLDVITAHTAHPTLFHYGVQVDNLFYNSPDLAEIRFELGGRPILEARYREEDVGLIHVLDPRTEEFIEVPCTNRVYAKGLNRAVHRLVVAEARKRFNDEWKQEQLLEIREEIQAIVDKALQAKRIADRKDAARALMQDSEAVFEASTAASDSDVPDDANGPTTSGTTTFEDDVGDIEGCDEIDLPMEECA